VDVAEARLEAVLVSVRSVNPRSRTPAKTHQARRALGGSLAQAALLARDRRIAELAGDDVAARRGFDAAIAAARDAGQKGNGAL
jgi:hypothetical protein